MDYGFNISNLGLISGMLNENSSSFFFFFCVCFSVMVSVCIRIVIIYAFGKVFFSINLEN